MDRQDQHQEINEIKKRGRCMESKENIRHMSRTSRDSVENERQRVEEKKRTENEDGENHEQ